MNKPDPDSLHQKMIDFLAEGDRIIHADAGLLVLPPASSSRTDLAEILECTCIEYCDEDPKTACSLSGIPHVHPETPGFPGIIGPCPTHPERPGDH